jgi:deoxycytidine triphosphate deaminase
MATVLSDRDIKRLIGLVLKDAQSNLINPNGIELRLGGRARFISTGEECEIPVGSFLQIRPGESVVIASLESLDFSRETVSQIFPDSILMALITPTTTMMREGAMNVATKVDAGFVGQLNWGLRNNSYKDLILQHGESIFKLTLLLLQGDEIPEKVYGDRDGDKYQNTEGIKLSGRRLPADIPKSKLVGSSITKLDPKKQLREAGYPFDHISSELIQLDGKFEMVSRDVASLTEKIDETRHWIVDHVENLFSKKFSWLVGSVIGGIALLYGVLGFLKNQKVSDSLLVVIAGVAGIIILVGTTILSKRR